MPRVPGLILSSAFLVLFSLGGCNKPADADPKAVTQSAPAAPEAPTPPEAVQAVPASQAAPAAAPSTAPTADAGAGVSVHGTEARAGDVSVKLPD